MKIAVDKNSLGVVDKDNEYIYLFDNESYEELIKLNVHCIRYDLCDYVDINLTDYDIDCIKKAKITDKDYDKLPDKVNYKIGIIIPNYNYEHTIERCLNSILNQTYKNFEIIFVDDMSTDNSVNIAYKTYQKYLYDNYGYYDEPSFLLEKFKVIQLKQKRLNGGARNEAYLHLSDDVDYVWYVDSDDWLDNDGALETINNYLQDKPDVVFVGMNQMKNGKKSLAYSPNYKDKYEAMQGWSGSCGKIIKKRLTTRQDCLYNEGTLKEDRNQHYKICINMKSFKNIKKPLYVWNRDNHKSVTTVRENIIWGTSTIRHWADTLQLYLTYKGQDTKLDEILSNRVEMTKQEALNGGDKQY